ncbi:MAG: hypothetical protein ABI411_12215 [Tahibacter sp.]
MRPAEADLAQRRPVWSVLSELYLDTDVASSLPHIAQLLAETDYATEQLQTILFDEVHAVLHWNLLAPTGVWDGFDLVWLEQEILKRCRRPRWLRAKISRAIPRHYWQQLLPLIDRARAATNG